MLCKPFIKRTLLQAAVMHASSGLHTCVCMGHCRFGRSKAPKSPSAPVEDEHEFSHMRYTCTLKHTVDKLLQDDLSIEEYPSVVPLPESATSGRKDEGTCTLLLTLHAAQKSLDW